ncbi:uncharacterized protein ELE39_002957 [Cryptosporidium sp. chipmunk genotype I]|uniref:uncharacterized protein n=1 Tax=Cryptosporidium sp. chipmunk genotype I TaxID=1280935 RepID=UPI003519FC1B|nr:hypothetical protein ELE39_002957 [Cryptosporidium sp. chipmunk genotype I]
MEKKCPNLVDGVPFGNCDPYFPHPCNKSDGKGVKCRVNKRNGGLVCCHCSNTDSYGPYSPPSSHKKYFKSACAVTGSPIIKIVNGQETCIDCLNDMFHCGNKPPRSKDTGYYSHPCNLGPNCRPGFYSGPDLKSICVFCANQSSHGPYQYETSESNDDHNYYKNDNKCLNKG